MRVYYRGFLCHLKLDRSYSLLNGRDVSLALLFFKALDVRQEMAIDDVQFLAFMQVTTDLSKSKIYRVFDMLDVDRSGMIDFDEFYLLLCILLAVRDKLEKQFILRHSRTAFELLDVDGSTKISTEEFVNFGFLFNFDNGAARQIFKEFDVSGDQELDLHEFKMFAMACIDRQTEIEQKRHPTKERRGDKEGGDKEGKNGDKQGGDKERGDKQGGDKEGDKKGMRGWCVFQ